MDLPNARSQTLGHSQMLPPPRQTDIAELQSQKTRQQEREICLRAARLSPEAGERNSLISPCLSSPRQFLQFSLTYWDHPFCKAQSCPLGLDKAGLEEGWLLTFSFSLYSRWTEW